MNRDDILKRFEADQKQFIAGSIAPFQDGFVICPLLAETHESTIGFYYYYSDKHPDGKLISLPAKISLELNSESIIEDALTELLDIGVKADESTNTTEQMQEYVLSNAPDYIRRYIETDTGKHWFNMYIKKG